MDRYIALISEHASPLAALGGVDSGGQNVYVANLARQLAQLGYHVDVLTRKDSAELPDVIEWNPRVRIINVRAGPAAFVRKEELLPFMDEFGTNVVNLIRRQGRYDLTHANFWMSGIVAVHLKALFQIPFVITFHALGRVRRIHQGSADEFPEARFRIEDWLVQEADHIIAECPQDQQDLVRLYDGAPEKIMTIPCGFDPGEFYPIERDLARKQLKLPPDEFIVLQLGRMVPRKGVDNVVRGVALLKRKYNVPARLLIVGGESDDPDPRRTPEIGRLQKIAAAEQIKDRILFAGRQARDRLKLFYSAADVFVTTPWYEPFGMTPLEAMACGTPVVGAQVGGIQYSVRDGETGYLVPPRAPDALAERLAYLYADPEHRRVLSRRALAHVNAHFTWNIVARRIAALYDEVLGSSASDELLEGAALAHVLPAAGRTLAPARSEVGQGILISSGRDNS